MKTIKLEHYIMQLLTAKIIWFPDYLESITEDYLENKIEWEKNHLNNVRQYMKEDGLLFPGVVMYNKHVKKMELHCGHYRFKVAKEMGYDGIDVYEVNNYRDVLYLTKFTENCYKQYLELKKIKDIHEPESKFI